MSIHGLPPIPPPPSVGAPQGSQFPEPWQALSALLNGWVTSPPLDPSTGLATDIGTDIKGILPLLFSFIDTGAANSAWAAANPTKFEALQAAYTTLVGVTTPTGTDLATFLGVLNANMPTISNATDRIGYNVAMKASLASLSFIFNGIELATGAPVEGEPGVKVTQVQVDELVSMAAFLHAFANGGEDSDNAPIFTTSTGSTVAITILNQLTDPKSPTSINSILSGLTRGMEIQLSALQGLMQLADNAVFDLDS